MYGLLRRFKVCATVIICVITCITLDAHSSVQQSMKMQTKYNFA